LKILLVLIAILMGIGVLLFIWTSVQVLKIEDRFPPAGQFSGIDGERTHFVDLSPDQPVERPPIVFIHGASGNLNDQLTPFAPVMGDRARLIFVDRPGHGYSERGSAENPAQQAERYKLLLDDLEIEKAVLVGHSLGAASIAAFGVLYPERTAGLVFVAPATHSWPTGVSWYYDLAATPLLGSLFTETLLVPLGQQSLESGSKSVFAPQLPPENYVNDAAISLVLRPGYFRHSARDVANLNEFVKEFSSRYGEITAPSIVLTGDKDDVVLPAIHSVGLERDVKGAKLIVLPGIGHKPEYAATQAVIDAIDSVSGSKVAVLDQPLQPLPPLQPPD